VGAAEEGFGMRDGEDDFAGGRLFRMRWMVGRAGSVSGGLPGAGTVWGSLGV
jgi:hypothetical protein